MAYIGGVHHFFGAVLGAITITWLQVSLSDYTTAWQLYLGLFFMAVVCSRPEDSPGFIADAPPDPAHARLPWPSEGVRDRGGPLAHGASERSCCSKSTTDGRRSPMPARRCGSSGSTIDTATPWPWLAALALLVAGAFSLSPHPGPCVARAWQAATDEARAAGGVR